MDITRAEQIALDDALVAPANRLKIGKSNLRLSSDLKSKEATLQVVYDVLKLTPFYKAFQITADVPEIYMQEFWATAKVHHHSIRFKMNNKKHIVNLEYFRAMLQICPKLPNQQFEELPFEEAILTFLRDLGHSGEIKVITDVNVNKLHQPWRSFVAVINKCLSGKSTGYDSLRLSQAQILWGMYHKKNVDYAYLLWEDFFYQVQNKNVKKSNEMYYPRFTKVIANFFMTKDQSIPRRNSVNWYYAKDDHMFTTIKVVSRHEDTPLYGAEPPKTKAYVKKKQVESDKAKTPPATKGKRLKTTAKKSSSDKDDDAEIENDNDNNDVDNQDDDGREYDEHDDEEQGDDDAQTGSDNDDDDEAIQDANVEGDKMNEEETNKEAEVDALYRDVNVNLEGRDTEMTDAPRTIVQTTQVIEDTHVIITPVNPEGQQQSSSVSSGFVSNMLNPSPDTGIDSLFNLNTESTSLVDVPVTTFAEPPLLKTLENNFSEFNQTNQFAAAVSSIPGIVDAYLANKMHEAVKTAIQLQSERLRDEAQAKNADFINKLDDNIKKIIKDQVKEQVKAQVSKILPKIEKTINEQLEAEVLTHSSNKSKTSHNLYKALVDAYESDKLILDTYGDTVSFKIRIDDEDKDEEPSAGSNRGSKRRRAGKESESTSEQSKRPPRQLESQLKGPNLITSLLASLLKQRSQSKPPTPNHNWNKTFPDAHGPVQPWLSYLAQMEDPYESFNKLMDTPLDFSSFVMNRLKVDTLTPELLAGPTFELMKGSCKSLVELEYFFEEVYKAATDQLD
ncbi:hypothetical protein Tco_1069251 [Tanacetum coccineum]|uniref:Monodehydroascorbate reductase n=1 Tax=Tanacetum coccineum TaxID=301880 RepID=A0ABQ5HI77_9ASTR